MTMMIENLSDDPHLWTTTSHTITQIDGPTIEGNGALVEFTGPTGTFKSMKDDGDKVIAGSEEFLFTMDLKFVDCVYILVLFNDGGNYYRRWINLQTKEFGSAIDGTSGASVIEKLINLNNGWCRYSIRIIDTNPKTFNTFLYMVNGDTSTNSTIVLNQFFQVANVTSGALGTPNMLVHEEVNSFLYSKGYVGTFNDRMVAWLRNLFGVTTGSYNDLLARYKKLDTTWNA